MTNPELIFYSPPKANSYGHAIREKVQARAAQRVEQFLAAHTVFSGPSQSSLWILRGTEYLVEDQHSQAAVDEARGLFGAPWRDDENNVQWRLSLDDHASAFALASRYASATRASGFCPVTYSYCYEFTWRESQSRVVCPESRLNLVVGKSLFVQPDLWFPFSDGDAGFWSFIEFLGPDLPFVLASKHFRRAVSVDGRDRYRFSKLEKSPR